MDADWRGLTVAICTRHRPEELSRCIASVGAQTADYPLQVLIVDDGELAESELERLRGLLSLAGRPRRLEYRRKTRPPGLLHSRIEAVHLATYPHLLFLDDDAELEDGYLERLRRTYGTHPGAAAVGGTDAGIACGPLWRLFTLLILYDSGRPGRLSASGYGGSMTRWNGQPGPFPTEYLLGCNMSFRTDALRDLPAAEWLAGYSLGEDLYLSHWASRRGELWLDPGLRVVHAQSPASRDKLEQVAYTEIVNHHYLLRVRGASPWRHAAQLWTAAGLLARSLAVRRWRPKAAGYARGIRSILAESWKRRLFHEGDSDLGDGGKSRRGEEIPGEAGSSNVPEL